MRIVTVSPPEDEGTTDGLRWTYFAPESEPAGAVLVLHGADSSMISHQDYARACRTVGFAALCADLRGHGASDGPMDGRIVEDVVTLAGVLREHSGPVPLALRGSSMGGYLALVAAAPTAARAVVAICPASAEGLSRGLRTGRFSFAADRDSIEPVLDACSPLDAAAALGPRLMLLHAEGDEQVPIAHSRELHAAAPGSKLVAVPGGHHRSIQHDAELQGHSLRFLARAFRADRTPAEPPATG